MRPIPAVTSLAESRLQHGSGVRALHDQLGHQRHVEHADGLAHGVVLARHDVVRCLPAEVQRRRRVLPRRGEPLRELPACRLAEVRALRGEAVVQDRAPDVPRGRRLPGRPHAVTEQDAELLDGPLLAEAPGRLIAGRPVERRCARCRPAGRPRRSTGPRRCRRRHRTGCRASSARRRRSSRPVRARARSAA